MNDFVNYLNSTNNVGGDSTGSLAEKQVKSRYYDFIKVDRTGTIRPISLRATLETARRAS